MRKAYFGIFNASNEIRPSADRRFSNANGNRSQKNVHHAPKTAPKKHLKKHLIFSHFLTPREPRNLKKWVRTATIFTFFSHTKTYKQRFTEHHPRLLQTG